MANLDELRRLGLFLVPGFFPLELCRGLCRAANAQRAKAAPIMLHGVITVDSSVRHAGCYNILEDELDINIGDRLSSTLPTIADHFEVSLTDYEVPQIVRYPVGGFYRPHIDSAPASCGNTSLSGRKISCVVFLNSSAKWADNGSFVGGALAFLKLVESPTWGDCKTLLYPVSGLLVAFRSNVYHEVLPVMAGERFTFVTWFR
jgi:SM-20-related protein